MKSIAAMKKQNRTALQEIRSMQKRIANQRVMVANTVNPAGGDPQFTARMRSARQATLRKLEEEALAKLRELEVLADQSYAVCSAGVIGVILSPSERAEVIRFALVFPNMAKELTFPEVLVRLRAAVLYDDRPAKFFFNQVVRSRLHSGESKLGKRTRDRGWEVVISPKRLHALLNNVDESLRYVSELPLRETADELMDEVIELREEIWKARALRGEVVVQTERIGGTLRLTSEGSGG